MPKGIPRAVPLLELSPDELRAYRRERYRARMQENPDRERNRRRIDKRNFRKWFRSLKYPCVVCGEAEPCCLDWHHINDQKEHNLSHLRGSGNKQKVLEELEKCVCVCSNCHRKIHAGLVQL